VAARLMDPYFTLQQLEGQDRLSRLTDDNHPLPTERFEGAEASFDFSLEGNNDSSSSQSQVSLLEPHRPSYLVSDVDRIASLFIFSCFHLY
jgi:hypothetical protein